MLRLSEEQASTWATTDKEILLKNIIFCLHKQQQHVNDQLKSFTTLNTQTDTQDIMIFHQTVWF